jgi:hypothetical protein
MRTDVDHLPPAKQRELERVSGAEIGRLMGSDRKRAENRVLETSV